MGLDGGNMMRMSNKRLGELMEITHTKQVDLINYVEEQGINLADSTMSNFVSGQRSIPRKFVELFSKCMETKLGYLIGADYWECESYFEYLESYNKW